MSANADNNSPADVDVMIEDALAYAGEMAALRAQRRSRFENVTPNPRKCIVAWIDILGFREQIRNAKTTEEFQTIYQRMLRVHAEFDKASASVEPDQEQMNTGEGKTIIALSDGLVIAQDLEDDRPLAEVTSHFDQLLGFLEDLRLAQACCAHAGNFVRGGVAIGLFWFGDDVLLSPGLVAAYEIETFKSKNPAVVLERSIVEELKAGMLDAGYFENSRVLDDLWIDCDWMVGEDQDKYVMLNFMPSFHEEEDPVPFLKRFITRAREAREAAIDKAKPKYDWLLAHARAFVANDLTDFEEEIFDSIS